MKKKLFMMLMAACSLMAVPSCSKDDEPAKGKDGQEQTGGSDDKKEEAITGVYAGPLSLDLGMGDPMEITPSLDVNVKETSKSGDVSKVDLSLDAISLMGISVPSMQFKDVAVTWTGNTGAFAFSDKASIEGEQIPVEVQGSIKNDGSSLEFMVIITQEGATIPVAFKGAKK